MKILTRTLATIGISAAAMATLALPASAAHESNNRLQFAPVSGSAGASGTGTINYVKGTSGAEPNTEWTSSFRFRGLEAGVSYTVVLRGRFADPMAFSEICSFTANAAGVGSCSSQFTGLRRLAVAQLRTPTATGTPVLQATRQSVIAGPGTITSSGGCREPDQMGSTC